MALSTLFTGFTETLKNFLTISLGSKHGELKELHKLLNDFKNPKPATIETINPKNRIMNNVNQLYNKYVDTSKKNYNCEDLNKKIKKILTLTSFKCLVRKNKNQSRLKKILRQIQKPLWFEIKEKEFED